MRAKPHPRKEQAENFNSYESVQIAQANRLMSENSLRYSTVLFDWGDTVMRDYPERITPMMEWETVEVIDGIAEVTVWRDFYVVQVERIRHFIFRNHNSGPGLQRMPYAQFIKCIWISGRKIGYH